MTRTSHLPLLAFALFATGVIATAAWLSRALPTLERADAVAVGITLDLTLLVPAAWYVLVVRRRNLPWISVVPIGLLGLFVATRLLPEDHHAAVDVVEAIVVPLELGVLAWIAWRARRAFAAVHGDPSLEPLARYHAAARGLVGSDRAAAIVATELALFHYALAAWKSRPDVPTGAETFSYHVRSGLGGLVGGFLFLLAGEGLAVHLLVHTWSATLAWFLTLGNVYAALYLLADLRASILRPVLVVDDTLVVRGGLRWTAEVPIAHVTRVTRTEPDVARKNLMAIGSASTWVVFDRAVELRGPYGTRRTVEAVGLTFDDGAALERAVSGPTL